MGDINQTQSKTAAAGTYLEFENVTGFFLQDDPNTDLGTFDMMSQNFGLIDQPYDTDASLPNDGQDLTQWQRFANKLKTLNDQASEDTSYRLLYLGRHGQGYHNIGESFYGSDAWNCYYSTLDADSNSPEIVFSDAHLTKLGLQQAQLISKFWSGLITNQAIPTPQIYYVSPLSRAIETAEHTFGKLLEETGSKSMAPYKPIVKELFREGHGIHTCDRRSTRAYLEATFPYLTFLDEDNFTEQDDIYSPIYREPPGPHSARMLALLRDIFSHENTQSNYDNSHQTVAAAAAAAAAATYISMTGHSGSIAALLRAVGHREFSLPTGGAIPVLLKITRKSGSDPTPPFDVHDKTDWETKPDCTSDPLKAGKKGYKNIGEYTREIEKS